MLTIFSTHAMSESAGILSMRIKRFSIVSYYTGIPEDEKESQYFVALVLSENENPNSFEESLTEIAKMVIEAINKPGFEDFYIECFERVGKMKEITEEQRYAFIFRDDVRSLMLSKLADASMTKEGLAKWLSKEVEREVTDIDGLLAPLVKTDLVTELNISKGKKVSLEYVFLLRDVALIRTPQVEVFKAAKSGQMAPELAEKYVRKIEKFFKSYRITAKDSKVIAEFISNPDTYDIIRVLREGYMTREEIAPKIGREMPNLDRHLKRLTEEDVILPMKDKKQRVWVFLQSDIQAITFFPEYMIDVLRRRWKEGTIAKEIALKHLELLRAEYISTQAPKFRKKMFESIQTNFETALSNIKKKKLDHAASNLEVCSAQAYDMGERKLGAEVINAAKLMREDKDKYISEAWDDDKAKILEFFEAITESLKEAGDKKPKKKKALDISEKKVKGGSEKGAELEKGKAMEIKKEMTKAKEEFSLGVAMDSFDTPSKPPSKPAPAPKKAKKPSKPAPAPKEAKKPSKPAPKKAKKPKPAPAPKKPKKPSKPAPKEAQKAPAITKISSKSAPAPKEAQKAPATTKIPSKSAPAPKEAQKAPAITKISSKSAPAPKEAQKEVVGDSKSQINALEKEIKQLRKDKDKAKAAEMMSGLIALYKKAGNIKKAEQLISEQNKLTIEALKDLQADLLKQAKTSEKEKNWGQAADLYAQCKEISSNIFKAGIMSESTKVKEYTNLEKKFRAKAEGGS